MIFLKIVNNQVKAYTSQEEAISANVSSNDKTTGKPFDLTLSYEEWENANFTAHVEDGRIVLGEEPSIQREINEDNIRSQRKRLLRVCDRISPLYWETLNDEDKDACRQYRNALLNITELDGFPWEGDVDNAPWPIMPQPIIVLIKDSEFNQFSLTRDSLK